ncbi:Antibiotic biosynthesis monooxygenase [Legionella birminghamensis]|uniref:Antibiotic biosynthesis monooxygenase n=1 Tax=Legionella birminghamensis TaxID=28083 RepID=A0A378IJY7_9GAMM|nr:antibiotic biosynthesis monooxygenase family protein [Legionella birminghamensis]KTC71698.1 Antibiotic biosynthesis monooxygenase [Legionella birminghamensis]STX32464.1 Antibiotic biosynthesis monooxygenase [Legionella birminghamensis]
MVFMFTVVTKESTREEFIHSFEMMKSVPGFQSIALYQDLSNKNRFTCVEYWDSHESHTQHVKEIPDEVRDQWLSLLDEISPGQFYEKITEVVA